MWDPVREVNGGSFGLYLKSELTGGIRSEGCWQGRLPLCNMWVFPFNYIFFNTFQELLIWNKKKKKKNCQSGGWTYCDLTFIPSITKAIGHVFMFFLAFWIVYFTSGFESLTNVSTGLSKENWFVFMVKPWTQSLMVYSISYCLEF